MKRLGGVSAVSGQNVWEQRLCFSAVVYTETLRSDPSCTATCYLMEAGDLPVEAGGAFPWRQRRWNESSGSFNSLPKVVVLVVPRTRVQIYICLMPSAGSPPRCRQAAPIGGVACSVNGSPWTCAWGGWGCLKKGGIGKEHRQVKEPA